MVIQVNKKKLAAGYQKKKKKRLDAENKTKRFTAEKQMFCNWQRELGMRSFFGFSIFIVVDSSNRRGFRHETAVQLAAVPVSTTASTLCAGKKPTLGTSQRNYTKCRDRLLETV